MKKILIIFAAILSVIVILLLVGGPVLEALGVEVFCFTNENGSLKFVRCGGSPDLVVDPSPPQLHDDAQPTLIDTDMAADDWLAILYLLQRPDVDVRAITVTGAGEAHCDPGVQNALGLVNFAGRPEIPVSCGRETPIAGDHVFPTIWRQDVDALVGIKLPDANNQPYHEDAVALLASTIQESGGELEIITLGPLTNLAELFSQQPALAAGIKDVYIMGGAFDVPGNIDFDEELRIENDVAEWNIYIDPSAAAMVVASGAPVTFVPLDASNHVLLDEEFYDRLAEDRMTQEAEFVFQVLTENIGFLRSGDYYFWDPLTAVLAVDESLGTFLETAVAIVEEEGPHSGATRVDEIGYHARYATSADGERFKDHFLDWLNGR